MTRIECFLRVRDFGQPGAWRMPIQPGAVLEVWDGLHLPGAGRRGILDLLAMHIRTAWLSDHGRRRVSPAGRERLEMRLADDATAAVTGPRHNPPTANPSPPLRGSFPPERQAALREKRRQRRRA